MDCTVGVRATGEKTAREPEESFTVFCQYTLWKGGGGIGKYIPTVPLPPNLINPNRRNGVEKVVIPGTTSLITMTSSGFLGTSLSDILLIIDVDVDVVQNVG